ncbi:MAG: hypothetical protein ACE366_22175 [Bradymonadia bacterium]
MGRQRTERLLMWALRTTVVLSLTGTGCDDESSDTTPVDMGTPPDSATVDQGPDPSDMGADSDAAFDESDASPWRSIEAANTLPAAHPLAEGQHRFLYDTFGVELYDDWPPTEFLLQLMEDEPEIFGDQFSSFGFIPDPDDDLPVGFKRGVTDPERVHHTCAVCHVGALPDGRLWLGAPNGALDFGRFRVEVDRRWVAAGNPTTLGEGIPEKFLALGPGRTNAASNDFREVVPADYPPYFRLGELSHLNYLGTGRNTQTEVYLSIYTFGAGAPDDEEAPTPFPEAERAAALVDFMAQIEPPAPPAEMLADDDTIARGRTVFEEAGCGLCHHPDDVGENGVTPIDKAENGRDRLPGEDAEWPEGSIHTSPLHRVLIDGDGEGGGGVDEGRLALIRFIGRHRLRTLPTDGYRVTPLQGLWATAPYLHNGSVPTLEDVLKPVSDRPTTFDRSGFTIDTSLPPNSNRGHAFGVDLSAEDKAALVAYLMSL